MDRNNVMRQWDTWRIYIAKGGGGSWPRDAFESVLDEYDEELVAMRDVVEAARTFKAIFDELLPKINGAFAFMQNHGGKYTGPTMVAEMTALDEALARLEKFNDNICS